MVYKVFQRKIYEELFDAVVRADIKSLLSRKVCSLISEHRAKSKASTVIGMHKDKHVTEPGIEILN